MDILQLICRKGFPLEDRNLDPLRRQRTNAYSYQIGHQGYTKEAILSKSTLKNA